jgi:hypothetical protein
MTIMIKMFLIFVRIYRISLFLDYPSRILGDITWRPQKYPKFSNSKTRVHHFAVYRPVYRDFGGYRAGSVAKPVGISLANRTC